MGTYMTVSDEEHSLIVRMKGDGSSYGDIKQALQDLKTEDQTCNLIRKY